MLFKKFFLNLDGQDCFDQQYSNSIANLQNLHIIQKIAVIAPLGAFYFQTSIDDTIEFGSTESVVDIESNFLKNQNGNNLVKFFF